MTETRSKIRNETERQLLDELAEEVCADLGVDPDGMSPTDGLTMRGYMRERIREFNLIQQAASKFEFYRAYERHVAASDEQTG